MEESGARGHRRAMAAGGAGVVQVAVFSLLCGVCEGVTGSRVYPANEGEWGQSVYGSVAGGLGT